MARYKRPRRLNVVSLLIFGALAAGVYAAVVFGPHYYRSYEVREILGDAASHLAARPGQDTYDLRYKVEQRIRAAGVEDPAVRVDFDVTEARVTALAEYEVIVEHPLTHRTTTLRFDVSEDRLRRGHLP
jgi:hypothetical protein